jgi:hypothetical protein
MLQGVKPLGWFLDMAALVIGVVLILVSLTLLVQSF